MLWNSLLHYHRVLDLAGDTPRTVGGRIGVHFATSLRHGTAHGQGGRERELFIQEGNRAPMSKASTCIGLVDIRRWGRACLSSASLWGLCVHRGDVQQTRRWASGVAELHTFVSGQPPLRRDVGRSSGGCLGASRVGRCGQVTLNCISTRRLVVTSQKRRSKLPRPGGGGGHYPSAERQPRGCHGCTPKGVLCRRSARACGVAASTAVRHIVGGNPSRQGRLVHGEQQMW